jgi:pimeloyl-ACP methyl ester carboxylesterase
MSEREIVVRGRSVLVREAGAPGGSPLLYFHGTPGSRLDVAFGDDVARSLGVRVVSFDRPGYGGSEVGAVSLSGVAGTAAAIADELGIDRFPVFGWSGGGPYALAAAAVLGDRVTRVGIAAGPGPFQEVPGALDRLGDVDLAALAHLPGAPARAAEGFTVGSETMLALRDDEATLTEGMAAMFGEGDADLFADPVLRHALFVMVSEGMRQGFLGVGWDNVAWVGPWDIDLAAVSCPVHLWYGERDQMTSPDDGRWLAAHVDGAELTVFPGEGHLGPMRHWPEMLGTLVG